MGGFYGSTQIHTSERDRVIEMATKVARAAGIRCLIGPELNGWVGVYGQHHGQDQSFGAALAEELGGYVIHMLVHDDDVMAYWLWRDGKQIDSYFSAPGYFDEADRVEQEGMSGNPAAFEPLAGASASALSEILERWERAITFEMDRLDRVAQVLGIRNAVTSYEYLKSGEVDDIVRAGDFVEAPADLVEADAKARAAEEQARIADEKARLARNAVIELTKSRLKRAYVLLCDVVEERLLPRACATADGFLVAWEGHGRAESRIELYRAPWGEAEPGEIETGGQVNAVASDAAGRHVAMALGNRAVVWATRGWKPMLELVESDWAVRVALSADGKLLAYASREAVYVSEIGSGRPVTALGGREGGELALHPSNEWIVAAGSALWIARVDSAHPWRELYVGGRAQAPGDLAAAVQRQMSQVDLDAIEKKWRDSMDAAFNRMVKSGSAATPEMLVKMRQQMQKQLEQMRGNFARLKEGKLPPPRRGNETVATVGFSRDGRWIWCGTDKGLRVYEWSAVAAATGDQMPEPRWAYPASESGAAGSDTGNTMPPASSGPIYAIAEDPSGNAIFFGGFAGSLYRMDLTTGETRALATLPDGGAITGICAALDGSAIGVCSRPGMGSRPSSEADDRAVWQIWSYSALLANG